MAATIVPKIVDATTATNTITPIYLNISFILFWRSNSKTLGKDYSELFWLELHSDFKNVVIASRKSTQNNIFLLIHFYDFLTNTEFSFLLSFFQVRTFIPNDLNSTEVMVERRRNHWYYKSNACVCVCVLAKRKII